MSSLHLYAVQGGSGAYLSQPTLTGRFLISAHCQSEHLRRLLPQWPEMRGRLRWKDVERERERKGWRTWKGQGWKEDSDEGEEIHMMLIIATHASSLYFSLIFFMLNTSHIRLAYRTVEKEKGERKHWTYPLLVRKVLAFRQLISRYGNLEFLQLDQQSPAVLS